MDLFIFSTLSIICCADSILAFITSLASLAEVDEVEGAPEVEEHAEQSLASFAAELVDSIPCEAITGSEHVIAIVIKADAVMRSLEFEMGFKSVFPDIIG